MKNIILDAITSLVEAQVDFVVCGGVACVLHGSPRVTMDLDIAVNMDESNLEIFIKAMKAAGFRPRIPEPFDNLLDEGKREAWLREKNALVYTVFSDVGFQIDVFLSYPLSYEELKNGAEIFEIEGHEFRVSSIPDLIRAKKSVDPPRAKDVEDIEVLERLANDKQN